MGGEHRKVFASYSFFYLELSFFLWFFSAFEYHMSSFVKFVVLCVISWFVFPFSSIIFVISGYACMFGVLIIPSPPMIVLRLIAALIPPNIPVLYVAIAHGFLWNSWWKWSSRFISAGGGRWLYSALTSMYASLFFSVWLIFFSVLFVWFSV